MIKYMNMDISIKPSAVTSYVTHGLHGKVQERILTALQNVPNDSRNINKVVAKICDENKYNIIIRFFDYIFNGARKQKARDLLISLTIINAYYKLKNELTCEASGDIANALGEAIGINVKQNGYQDLSKLSAYILHVLKKLSGDCDFAAPWSLTNLHVTEVEREREPEPVVYSANATVSLIINEDVVLSFPVATDDVAENEFIKFYLPQNGIGHAQNALSILQKKSLEHDGYKQELKKLDEKLKEQIKEIIASSNEPSRISIKIAGLMLEGLKNPNNHLEDVKQNLHELRDCINKMNQKKNEFYKIIKNRHALSKNNVHSAESMTQWAKVYAREIIASRKIASFLINVANHEKMSSCFDSMVKKLKIAEGGETDTPAGNILRTYNTALMLKETNAVGVEQASILETLNLHNNKDDSCEQYKNYNDDIIKNDTDASAKYYGNLSQAFENWTNAVINFRQDVYIPLKKLWEINLDAHAYLEELNQRITSFKRSQDQPLPQTIMRTQNGVSGTIQVTTPGVCFNACLSHCICEKSKCIDKLKGLDNIEVKKMQNYADARNNLLKAMEPRIFTMPGIIIFKDNDEQLKKFNDLVSLNDAFTKELDNYKSTINSEKTELQQQVNLTTNSAIENILSSNEFTDTGIDAVMITQCNNMKMDLIRRYENATSFLRAIPSSSPRLGYNSNLWQQFNEKLSSNT